MRKVCAGFDDAYWTECEEKARFPHEYYQAMAEGGWLGITMPEELRGSGLGVSDAAVMMHAATLEQRRLLGGLRHPHQQFGPHAIVVHGTPDRRRAGSCR